MDQNIFFFFIRDANITDTMLLITINNIATLSNKSSQSTPDI